MARVSKTQSSKEKMSITWDRGGSWQSSPQALYRVRLTSGDSFVRLKNRMVVANEEGYVIVNPEEYEQLKALKVC